MTFIYHTKMNNIQNFINKVQAKTNEFNFINVDDIETINKKYIFITPTYRYGEVPTSVNHFIHNNSGNLLGTIGSGNRNWGINYCKAAYTIASDYHVECLYTFELSGNTVEVARFINLFKGGSIV